MGDAYNDRGLTFFRKGDFDKAIADYTGAIRIDPRTAAIPYSNRGDLYRRKGELKRAAADLTEAVRLVPLNSVTHFNRGLLFEAMGKPHWALADLEEAVRLDPKNAEARFQRGLNYEDAKADCERAIADFNEVMLLTGKTARLYNARGYAYYYKGDYQQGISDLEEAVRLDPKWALAHRSLGWFLATCPEEQVRDGRKAVEHARRACELFEWKDWMSIRNLAAACAENGEFDEAVKRAKQAESLAPEVSKAGPRQLLALFEGRKPYHEEDTAFERGRTLLLQGDYDQAIASFDLALQRHGPRPGLCYINRGLAHRNKGDHDQAIDDMRQGLRLEPNNAFFNEVLALTHFMRSQSVAQKGDYERTIADLRQAVELKPDVVDYQAYLCLYLAACPKAELRNGQQAVEHATRACELTQWKEARSLRMLAVAHAEVGSFDEAVRWAQEASRLTPEAQRAFDDQLLQLFQSRKPFRLPDV
ncbi:MAG: tetratricopeptide repeat protein, partial [Planctomycetaceae bacterium]|nr:tetratricopeptide repeat protein [Planctomycetaceae bacterium]